MPGRRHHALALEHVGVLDRVDVDRLAVGVRRPALRAGRDRVAAVERRGVVGGHRAVVAAAVDRRPAACAGSGTARRRAAGRRPSTSPVTLAVDDERAGVRAAVEADVTRRADVAAAPARRGSRGARRRRAARLSPARPTRGTAAGRPCGRQRTLGAAMLTLALALAASRAARSGSSVTAPSTRSTTATLTFAECGRRVLGPWRARVGYNGLSAHHREGDGTTPLGTYRDRADRLRPRPQPRRAAPLPPARLRRLVGRGSHARRPTTASGTSPAARRPPSAAAARRSGGRPSPTGSSRSIAVQRRAGRARPRARRSSCTSTRAARRTAASRLPRAELLAAAAPAAARRATISDPLLA